MAKKLTQNVNKDKLLNDLPKVTPQMTKWASRHSDYFCSDIGSIVPIYFDEVLAGEKRKITMAMISHCVTPIAPIFNAMYTEIRCFEVPIRLCADLLNGYKTRKSPWVKVFGEDNASSNSNIIVPLANQKLPSFTTSHRFISDVYTYLSSSPKADNVLDALDYVDVSPSLAKSADYNYLALAAYELIYQRHYRNENFESATSSNLYRLLFDAYNSSKASVTLSSSFTYEQANREKDYFTGMKPFTQKGDPIHVGVGDYAPIRGYQTDANGNPTNLQFSEYSISGDSDNKGIAIYGSGYGLGSNSVNYVYNDDGAYASDGASEYGVLFADLKSAQGISVEELRLLIKTQELLEKDAMYGSLYAESLNAHFGCCPIDLTLQDPQELYKITITSNMQAIFQTSSTSGESSILGTIGANSTTQTDPFVILPEREFKEHSILMICAVHKLQNVYDTRYFKPKFNFKNSRFDFFTPELNDLGFQAVSDKEMRSSSSATVGFNEAFAEYRFKFNKSHGRLNSSFAYWAPAIGSEYSSAATLYKEDPSILDKALSVTSSTSPQFFDAWGFEEENTKPMSLHSIPGMDGVI